MIFKLVKLFSTKLSRMSRGFILLLVRLTLVANYSYSFSEENLANEFIRFEGDYTNEQFQKRPTRVLIHGCPSCRYWFQNTESNLGSSGWDWGSSNSNSFKIISEAYEKNFAGTFNVVELQWHSGSTSYSKNRQYVQKSVAVALAQFLNTKIGNNKERWRDLKVIGHSIGAHAAGFTGKQTINKIGTIIALDPAKPHYVSQVAWNRLAEDDAEYTECIHTESRFLGIGKPICHVNFYPNKGTSQPGCSGSVIGTCSHSRAYILFAESLRVNNFEAVKCDMNLSHCGRPRKLTMLMGGEPGNSANQTIYRGSYYLETNARSPFSKTLSYY